MPEIIGALIGCKGFDEFADQLYERRHGAGGAFAQCRLQLGECHFDGIEVWRIGGQIAHRGAGGAERLGDSDNLVGAQIIHEEDVVLVQCRHENLFDIGKERWPIHGAVDDIGRGQTIDAQGGNQGQRLPVAVRHVRDKALATRRTPVVPHHLRGDRVRRGARTDGALTPHRR